MTNTLKDSIIKSLNEYKGWVNIAGNELDLTNVDYEEIERDVQRIMDEDESNVYFIVDIIDYLFGQLGCKHYGIKYTSFN